MQKLALMTAIGLMAFAMIAPLGAASHCNGTVTDIGGAAYFDERDDGFVGWLYLESNGVAGLQSGGSDPLGDYEDPCAHPDPDTLVY